MKMLFQKALSVLLAALLCWAILLPASAAEEPLLGDVSQNSKVNSEDALLILKHAVQLITLTPEQESLANLNFDAYINSADALMVLKIAVRLIDQPSMNPSYDELEKLKIQEITAMRKRMLESRFTGDSVYQTAPDFKKERIGSLKTQALQDGLNAINYVRTIAGLPGDVVLDGQLTEKAQTGAFVLEKLDQFSHTPVNDGTVSDSLFRIGYGATSTSNIGYNYFRLDDFNLSCMQDEDNGNIPMVGHRRWILSPNMKKTGMGLCGRRSVIQVFDRSRNPAVYPDYVAWPAAGPFPSHLIYSLTPWSISLGYGFDSEYKLLDGVTPKVTLIRLNDGKKWVFDQPTGLPASDTDYYYYNVNTDSYGGAPAIIFRPGVEIQPGDTFSVQVENISKPIQYTVKIFKLD